jgi:hypothetical protein
MKTLITAVMAAAVVITCLSDRPTNAAGAKLGEVIRETIVCANLNDLKHAESLIIGDTIAAALFAMQYAASHDCTTIRQGMQVAVDNETDGYACIRIGRWTPCRWTVIQNVDIQDFPTDSRTKQQKEDDLKASIERTMREQHMN